MRAFAFLQRITKARISPPTSGHGFTYIETPPFYSSDTRRLALIRPYTPPKVSVFGNDRNGWIRRSIGGPQPALATFGQGIILSDPRGGNGPVHTTPGGSPLVNNSRVNASNAQIGDAGAYGSVSVPGTGGSPITAVSAASAAQAVTGASAQSRTPAPSTRGHISIGAIVRGDGNHNVHDIPAPFFKPRGA